LTPTATRHFGLEFGHELPLQLPGCCVAHVKNRHELLGHVAPIRVEGEQTAVLAAAFAIQALQLFPVIVPVRAVASYKCQEVGHERYDAIRIKVL